MVTRNVVLTDAQSAFIERLVERGEFQNASEALRAGLRLLERDVEELDEIRRRVREGLDQALRGDFVEGSGEEAVRRIFDETDREG